MSNTKISFASDYLEGAHPAILQRLLATNLEQTAGYGLDEYSDTARQKIRRACQASDAEIHFLVGGTQTNATVIDSLLRPYQGVLAADSGHVSIHEAGAIEYGGHKVLTLPQQLGKITASQITDAQQARLAEQVEFGFWEKRPEGRTVIRFATSWATQKENVDHLLKILQEN